MFRPTLLATSLSVLLTSSAFAQVCPGDDAFEENDTCATAVPIGAGLTPNLGALFGDPDYYEYTIPAGQSLTAQVLFSHGSGNIDAVLLSGCSTTLAVSSSTTDNETLAYTNTGVSPLTVQIVVMLSNNAGVDCNAYELLITNAAPTVTFAGLPHSAVGLAGISTTPTGKLLVDNLGSSGCDGVRIDIGDSDGLVIDMEPVDIAPSPNNTGTTVTVIGETFTQGLPPGEPIIRTVVSPNETTMEADFSSMGATSYGVDVFLDGVYQGSFSGLGNGARMSLGSGDGQGPCPPGMVLTTIGIICASPIGNPVNCNGSFCFTTTQCMPIMPVGVGGNGGMWIGNTLYFYPEGNGGNQTTWASAEVMFANTGNLPEVEIEVERVDAFGHLVQALDGATIEPNSTGGRLKVSNLGSSGCDGVSIANPGGGSAGSVEVEMMPIAIPCALITNESYGTINGVETPLGILRYQDPMDGTPLTISADHTSVGAQTSTVEIYDAGQLAATASGLSGELAKCNVFPTTCGMALSPNDGWPCALGLWSSPQQFEFQGGVVVGDEIRILAEGATAPSDLTRFDLCGADLPEIQIVDVRSTEAPTEEPGTAFCFGDGTGTNCPCGNTGPAASGCMNSAGTGARLIATGNPSQANDTLHFRAEGVVPNSFGVLVSADNQLNMAMGIQAFDGLRCVGGNLFRHGARASNAAGVMDGWGTPNGPAIGLMAQGGFSPNQTRHFQLFYREVTGQGCNTGQNTSHAVSITFGL